MSQSALRRRVHQALPLFPDVDELDLANRSLKFSGGELISSGLMFGGMFQLLATSQARSNRASIQRIGVDEKVERLLKYRCIVVWRCSHRHNMQDGAI
jgi:hypothetical protein